MNEKGRVTISSEIRDQKGDAVVVPVEAYSEERLKEFAEENALTVVEKRRFRKLLRG